MTVASVAPEGSSAISDQLHKQAAVEQWTADPCEERSSSGEPGTRAYFERLLAARRDYAPWMDGALDYAGAGGLDLLDVGCGQGIDLARFAMAGARVTGVDLTPRHVELARAHLAALGLAGEVESTDAEALPFRPCSFDRVSSNGVLHHTPRLDLALEGIARVLRPGGLATVIVYNKASLHYWLNQVVWEGIVRGGLMREGSMAGVLSAGVEYSRVGARPLVRVYSPRSMRRHLRAARFERVTTEVRQFKVEDAFPVAVLARVAPQLRRPSALDAIARRAGWYVVARGTKPA